MVFVLLTGCGLGWVVHRARVQRDAVAAIRKSGGRAVYDWETKLARVKYKGESLDVLSLNPNGRPRWPNWLVNGLGPDYFGTVVIVNLGRRASDEVMAHVGRLPHLQNLSISETPLSDSGMAHLRGLTQLKYLGLHLGTVPLPAAMAPRYKHLEGLTRLQRLSLEGLADADLSALRGMTDLRSLQLITPGLTDAGMSHLKNLVKLRQVVLVDGSITAAGLTNSPA